MKQRVALRRGMLPLAALLAGLFAPAEAPRAEPWAPGTALPELTLEDQHGNTHSIDDGARAILFTRDMDAGRVAREALGDSGAERLRAAAAVYIADVSRMPALVRRWIAEPRMRRRPYPVLLDREGDATRDVPAQEGRATLLVLERRRVTFVLHFEEAGALAAALRELEPGEPSAGAPQP